MSVTFATAVSLKNVRPEMSCALFKAVSLSRHPFCVCDTLPKLAVVVHVIASEVIRDADASDLHLLIG